VAEGLAFVLKSSYNFGGIRVEVIVVDPDGQVVEPIGDDPADPIGDTRRLFQQALVGNPYFRRIQTGMAMHALSVEIEPAVVQFWNDDTSDPNGYSHFLAADVFDEVNKGTFFKPSVEVDFYTGLKGQVVQPCCGASPKALHKPVRPCRRLRIFSR
jgi:hypothetical protein